MYVTRRHSQVAHKAWRQRPLRDKQEWLIGKGYAYVAGVLRRDLKPEEYGSMDPTQWKLHWRVAADCNTRELMDDNGRSLARQYIMDY